MIEDDKNIADSTGTDRGADRGERTDRGEAQELSHGRRDRSREMLREELERNLDDATRRTGGRPRDFEPEGRPAREANAESQGRRARHSRRRSSTRRRSRSCTRHLSATQVVAQRRKAALRLAAVGN